ncbi:MAG: hypothetical protein KBC30_03085 [Planctomycetes bacterium]|nr:hypothetical protein [Planctomycetota bacterium]HPY74224.1 hypothetical protein [Planctomycetota bacterium]HQB00053.1 hypothetical protein [Planctomycetota bacterium]HRU51267.1 hypothetical protein [Planctomycetota bacterium]
MVTEEKFLQIYGNLLVQTWGDAELKARFMNNPAEVLKEFGLDAGNATIELISPQEEATPECTPESQVKMWNEGLQSGKIQFVYPENPPEGISGELSEEQLEAVAGGWSVGSCCCTPCCSC